MVTFSQLEELKENNMIQTESKQAKVTDSCDIRYTITLLLLLFSVAKATQEVQMSVRESVPPSIITPNPKTAYNHHPP